MDLIIYNKYINIKVTIRILISVHNDQAIETDRHGTSHDLASTRR